MGTVAKEFFKCDRDGREIDQDKIKSGDAEIFEISVKIQKIDSDGDPVGDPEMDETIEVCENCKKTIEGSVKCRVLKKPTKTKNGTQDDNKGEENDGDAT